MFTPWQKSSLDWSLPAQQHQHLRVMVAGNHSIFEGIVVEIADNDILASCSQVKWRPIGWLESTLTIAKEEFYQR